MDTSDGFQVTTSQSKSTRSRAATDCVDEGEESEAFFGQLWLVPQPSKVRVPQKCLARVWIHKDSQESRQVWDREVCLGQEEDSVSVDPRRASWLTDFSGQGTNPSYMDAAKGLMAGRAGRGRGRGHGNMFKEEQWGWSELVESGSAVPSCTVSPKLSPAIWLLPSTPSIPELGCGSVSSTSPRAASIPGEQFLES
jgi:hypothetical protein